MPVLKKALVGVAAALLLLAVAAVALVTLVDADRFKPQLVQWVADHYQRNLAIDGRLSLTVFPRLALTLPRTTLSEPGNAREAARLEEARVGVALLPLLRGSIVADRIRVDGLSARVERGADGSTSIDDLLGRRPSGDPATRGQPSPAGTAGRVPEIRIAGLEITGARLQVDDRQSGQSTTIDRLNLSTGPIAPRIATPLSLSAAFAQSPSKAAGEFELKGDLTLDLDAGRFGAQQFDARLRATVGAAALAARIEARGFDADPKTWSIAKMLIDASRTDARRTVTVKLATPMSADRATGQWRLPGVEGELAIDDSRRPAQRARWSLGGQATGDLDSERVQVDLAADGEGTKLTAKLQVDGFSTPRIGFDIQADRLDVDRFLASSDDPALASASTPASTPATGAAGNPPAAGAASSQPLDLTPLRSLHVDGKLAVGRLRARGLAATDLSVVVKAADGRLDAAPIAAALYDGRLTGRLRLQAGATPASNRIEAATDLLGVAIGPLLKDLGQNARLEGRGNVRLDLHATGADSTEMKRRLQGNVGVALRDGAIRGINIAESLRQARSLLRGEASAETLRNDPSRKTDFTSLDASAAISDGVARSNDLDVKSPLLRIGGEGTADLVAGRLDYTVRASIVGSGSGQGGRELDDLRGVTVPIRLAGSLEEPSWQIDWATAAREALKSRAAAELKERLQSDERLDKAKEKARERIGDALKGLLNR